MASVDLTLGPNERSADFELTSREYVGIVASLPISVYAKGVSKDSLIAETSRVNESINVLPPGDTIYFIAGPNGSEVVYDIPA